MTRSRYARALRAISDFLLIFLVIAITVTCSVSLFITILSLDAGIKLDEENIGGAAKWTLIVVVVLSMVFTALEYLRRKIQVDDPVSKITRAAEGMAEGDFSVRISVGGFSYAREELAEIAESINKMAEELGSTETLRQDFISNVSHEIRTPLAIIRSQAAMLAEGGLSEEERRECVDVISKTSAKLSELVGGILKLSKLENGRIQPQELSFDLSTLLAECILGFEEPIEEKELQLEVDIEEDVKAYSDPELISIVINNLLSNAIKFTDRGGSIGASLAMKNGECILKISDTGCGMSADVGKHIFDKFYQAEGSRSKEGYGLGLAMVRSVIDITGSAIAVSSRPGEGSVFTVRIKGENNG